MVDQPLSPRRIQGLVSSGLRRHPRGLCELTGETNRARRLHAAARPYRSSAPAFRLAVLGAPTALRQQSAMHEETEVGDS